MQESILLAISSSKRDNITLSNFCQFDSYNVIYHCYFLLHFPDHGKPEILFMSLLTIWVFSSLNGFFMFLADFSTAVPSLLFKWKELFEIHITDFSPLIFLSCKDYFSKSKLVFWLCLWYFCHKKYFNFYIFKMFSFSFLHSRATTLI